MDDSEDPTFIIAHIEQDRVVNLHGELLDQVKHNVNPVRSVRRPVVHVVDLRRVFVCAVYALGMGKTVLFREPVLSVPVTNKSFD